jgi:hypothetical protein
MLGAQQQQQQQQQHYCQGFGEVACVCVWGGVSGGCLCLPDLCVLEVGSVWHPSQELFSCCWDCLKRCWQQHVQVL